MFTFSPLRKAPPSHQEIAEQRVKDAINSKLPDLSLTKMELHILPPSITNHPALERLSLSENYLSEIPSATFCWMVNLRCLSLQKNLIKMLPDAIGYLENLEVLYLSHNELRNVPTQLGRCQKLERLYLSNNLITSIPPQFGKLTNLTRLAAANNQIKRLPSELGNCTALQALYLKDNPLSEKASALVKAPIKVILRRLRNLKKKCPEEEMEAGLSLPPIGYYVGGEKKWVKEKDARHDFRPESKEGEDMDLGGGEEWLEMDEVQKSKEKEEENKGGKEEDEHVDFVMGDVAMDQEEEDGDPWEQHAKQTILEEEEVKHKIHRQQHLQLEKKKKEELTKRQQKKYLFEKKHTLFTKDKERISQKISFPWREGEGGGGRIHIFLDSGDCGSLLTTIMLQLLFPEKIQVTVFDPRFQSDKIRKKKIFSRPTPSRPPPILHFSPKLCHFFPQFLVKKLKDWKEGEGGGEEREEGLSMSEDRVEDCLLDCLQELEQERGGDWLSLVPVRKTIEELIWRREPAVILTSKLEKAERTTEEQKNFLCLILNVVKEEGFSELQPQYEIINKSQNFAQIVCDGKKAQITIRMVDYQPQDVLFSSLHNPSSTSNPEQLSVLDLLESGENEGEGEGGLGARCLTALSLFSLSKYNVVSLFVDDSMAFFPPPSSSTPLFWQYKDMDDFSLSAAASSPPSTPRTPPSFSSSAPPNIAPSSSSSSSSLFSFLSPFRGEKSTPRKIEKPSHRMDDLTEDIPAQKLVIKTGKATLVGKGEGGYQEGVKVVAGMAIGMGLAVSLWRMIEPEREGEEQLRRQHREALKEIFLLPSFPSSTSSPSSPFPFPCDYPCLSTAPLSLLASSISHLNLSLYHHTTTHNSLAFLQRSLTLPPPSANDFIIKMKENQKLLESGAGKEVEEEVLEKKATLLANLPSLGWDLPCQWDWLSSSSSPSSSPLSLFEALLFEMRYQKK